MARPTAPRWIRTPDELRTLVASLEGVGAVAIDTEADSLHHYPAKLCLVQIATDTGAGHLVDPLAVPDLTPLAPIFADPAVLKVLHAAENDLAYLKRLYDFRVEQLFDTAVAARFLGATALGLDELIRGHLGLELGQSRQKDDWSRRPLSPEQEAYALDDVHHLIPLRAKLLEALQGIGRAAWVEEECAALAAMATPERVPDPDAWFRLKGAKDLDARGLAVLRELYRERERLALEHDRPPFMIVSHDSLVALAARRPADEAAMATIPGMSVKVVRRHGAAIFAALARGEALPDAEVPARPRGSRPAIPGVVRRRVEALKAWRRGASERVGLEPGVLLPQRLIDRLAADAPADVAALARTEGVRRWRAELLGEELVKTLRSV